MQSQRQLLCRDLYGLIGDGQRDSAGIDKEEAVRKISNPTTVFRNFKRYKGRDNAVIEISNRPGKKYVVFVNPKIDNGLMYSWTKQVHFGSNLADFTKTRSEQQRQNYLKRACGIKGNWRNDKYSPNNLAINLLWN